MNQFFVNLKNWHFKRAFFWTGFKVSSWGIIFSSAVIFVTIKSDT